MTTHIMGVFNRRHGGDAGTQRESAPLSARYGETRLEVTGEMAIDAPRERLFDALHDPEVLAEVIPGCRQCLKLSQDRYCADIAATIGHLSALFVMQARVYNSDSPQGYSLHASAVAGDGIGGATGHAHIALAKIDDTRTNLAYHLSVHTSGAIALLPRNVLDHVARDLAADMLDNLKSALDLPEQPEAILTASSLLGDARAITIIGDPPQSQALGDPVPATIPQTQSLVAARPRETSALTSGELAVAEYPALTDESGVLRPGAALPIEPADRSADGWGSRGLAESSRGARDYGAPGFDGMGAVAVRRESNARRWITVIVGALFIALLFSDIF